MFPLALRAVLLLAPMAMVAVAHAANPARVAPLPRPAMYGLVRVPNSVSCTGATSGCSQLVAVDQATGVLSKIGAGHKTLAALGDLVGACGCA